MGEPVNHPTQEMKMIFRTIISRLEHSTELSDDYVEDKSEKKQSFLRDNKLQETTFKATLTNGNVFSTINNKIEKEWTKLIANNKKNSDMLFVINVNRLESGPQSI